MDGTCVQVYLEYVAPINFCSRFYVRLGMVAEDKPTEISYGKKIKDDCEIRICRVIDVQINYEIINILVSTV